MGALVYLRKMATDNAKTLVGSNYRRVSINFEVEIIGDPQDIGNFLKFTQTKLPQILKSYTMDWHVKEDTPEDIEFILNVMGRIMVFQSQGKLEQAKALLKLVEIILPEYQDNSQYHLAEELRDMIWDSFYRKKESFK